MKNMIEKDTSFVGEEYRDHSTGLIYEKLYYPGSEPYRVVYSELPANPENGSVGKHWHNSLELLLSNNTDYLVNLNGEEHLITHGQVCIIDCRNIHSIVRSVSEDPFYRGFLIHLKREYIERLAPEFEKKVIPLVLPDHENSLLYRYCTEFGNAVAVEKRKDALETQGYISLILSVLIRCGQQKTEPASFAGESGLEITERISEYIDAHLAEDLQIAQLADCFGFSQGYISRTFRRYSGLTLGQYIAKTRLQRAKEEIERTNRNIMEIALECGFPNSKSLQREFKNEFGTTPLNYRKKVRK